MSVDMTGASDAEFEARIAPFEAGLPSGVEPLIRRWDAEAIRRVEALAAEMERESPFGPYWLTTGDAAARIRAALASPAPAPQGGDA